MTKKKKREGKYLSQKKILNLLNTCETLRETVILLFFTDTGFRRSDIIKIQIEQIDFGEGESGIIEFKQQKSKKPVFMPLTSDLAKNLRMYINDKLKGAKNGALFPTPRGTRIQKWRRQKTIKNEDGSVKEVKKWTVEEEVNYITDKQIENILNNIIERAGLTDILPHDFRTTFITNAGAKGVDPELLHQALGVTPATQEGYYKKYTPSQIAKALDYRQELRGKNEKV